MIGREKAESIRAARDAVTPAVRAIAEDLVRLAAPFDTAERRTIAEDARRTALRMVDGPSVIPRFMA